MAMLDPINKIIMEEIGLTVDKQFRVIDQDSREPIIINDKYLKYSSQHAVPVKAQEQQFDPASSRGQMNILFDFFIGKIEEEGIPIDMYYDVHEGCALETKSKSEIITTDDYNRDSLKYADMIMKLNGSDTSILKSYDIAERRSSFNKRKKKKILDFERGK